jgi:hypothetical protein
MSAVKLVLALGFLVGATAGLTYTLWPTPKGEAGQAPIAAANPVAFQGPVEPEPPLVAMQQAPGLACYIFGGFLSLAPDPTYPTAFSGQGVVGGRLVLCLVCPPPVFRAPQVGDPPPAGPNTWTAHVIVNPGPTGAEGGGYGMGYGPGGLPDLPIGIQGGVWVRNQKFGFQVR